MSKAKDAEASQEKKKDFILNILKFEFVNRKFWQSGDIFIIFNIQIAARKKYGCEYI